MWDSKSQIQLRVLLPWERQHVEILLEELMLPVVVPPSGHIMPAWTALVNLLVKIGKNLWPVTIFKQTCRFRWRVRTQKLALHAVWESHVHACSFDWWSSAPGRRTNPWLPEDALPLMHSVTTLLSAVVTGWSWAFVSVWHLGVKWCLVCSGSAVLHNGCFDLTLLLSRAHNLFISIISGETTKYTLGNVFKPKILKINQLFQQNRIQEFR